MPGKPDVSVVIPTYNAGPEFEDLLGSLASQRIGLDSEVLVVDSGSSDGTVEMARRFSARVLSLPKSEFNHGRTRNRAISEARGEFVAMIVQDAMPADEAWLEGLVENMAGDEDLAGTYSRQIPRPDCNPFTRYSLEHHFTNLPERRVQVMDEPAAYESLPPAKKLELVVFDDVSSCLRRSVWEKHPYEPLNFGEDLEWAQRVIKAGYKVAYEPKSAVVHSHNRSALYEMKRAYATHKLMGELLGFRALPTLAEFRKRVPGFVKLRWRLAKEAGGTLPLYAQAVTRSVGDQTGVYLGGVAGSASERRRVPRAVDRYMTRGI